MRKHLLLFWCAALLAAPAQASSVAPLRLAMPRVVNIMPGHFDGVKADAVIITDGIAKLCKGPDYKRCAPIGQLETAKTVAVNRADGRSVLVQFDSPHYGQVCTLNMHPQRTTMDCKALDFTKLAAYQTQQVGSLLSVKAVDGHYFCSSGKSGMQCQRIANADGSVDWMTVKQQRDQGRASSKPFLRPVVIYYDDDLPGGFPASFDVWEAQEMERVTVQGYTDGYLNVTYGYQPAMGQDPWWRATVAATEPPPRNEKYQQCLQDCTNLDARYGNLCKIAAGLVLYTTRGNAIEAGAVFMACEFVRGIQDNQCRANCG